MRHLRSAQIFTALFFVFSASAQSPDGNLSLLAFLKTLEPQIENSSPRFVSQSARVDQARAIKRQGLSTLLPQVSAEYSGEKSDIAEWTNSASLVATQSLFAGGAEYWRLDALSRSINIEEAILADLRDELRARVFLALVRIGTHQERLKVLGSSAGYLNDRVKELSRRVKLGQSREPDLISSQLEQERTSRRLLTAQSELRRYQQELREIVANPDLSIPAFDFKEQVSLPELRQIFQGREDYKVKALRLNVDRLKSLRQANYFALLPTLAANARSNLVKSSPSNADWAVGLTASWALFEGFATPAAQAENKAQMIIAEKTLFETEFAQKQSQARLEEDLRDLISRMTTIKSSLDRADRALKIQQRDYKLGLVTELEVLSSLQAKVEIELELQDLRVAFAQSFSEQFLRGTSTL